MDKSFLHIKVISIYLLISAVCRISYSCSGFTGSGYTYPDGDIFIEYHTSTPLEITCVISNDTLIAAYPNISSKLSFKKDEKIVPRDKIIRLNETSIKLVEDDPEKMNLSYSCILNRNIICKNHVAVGTKPEPVEDFTCIGYNYENLTCSWTPAANYIPTNYSLSYTFPRARAGSRVSDCNVTDDKTGKKKRCYWDLKTHPHYRQAQEIYNFTLKSENRYGSLEQGFLFEHFKNILSGPPENLTLINSTTSSLLLSWRVPNPLVPIAPGLQHKILYTSTFDFKIWQNGGIIETEETRDIYYNLTGLKYAHDVYDVRVSIRVRGADSDKMWSGNSSLTALTSSTIPGAPPKVNVGSFQTDITSSIRDIYVYWQQIPNEIRNADDFRYDVTVDDESFDISKLPKPANSYVKFSGMSLHTPYKFVIRSVNSEGFSKESVTLTVPPNDQLISEPILFTKVSFDNGLYKLSWEEPKIGAQYVENYTLFWCINDKDRPYQCEGQLNWTVLSASTREYNVSFKEDSTTQFAISANNATSSSGMVWATCTLIHNKLITKIKEVWINSVSSTFIDLGWKLDCAHRSDSVAGYIIYYCPRGKEPACLKRMNTTIMEPKASSGRITGLTPYTTYMLTVSVLNTQGSESLESDPLYNTTYEDIPTEPHDLQTILVTNSSIAITWQPPKRLNGHLRNYCVFYNNNRTDTYGNRTSYILEYLHSNVEYNISVAACTLQCSNRSTAIVVRTRIGKPAFISGVWITTENNSLVLRWAKPEGSSNLFEVQRIHGDGNETKIISNITGTQFNLLSCDQDDKDNHRVRVRAINRGVNATYYGPWSDNLEASCNAKSGTMDSIWMIIAFGSIFLLVVVVLSGKKLYIHFHEMEAIDVKLPPGLDPQIDTSWTQPKLDSSPSDEELLLNRTFIPPCSDSDKSGGLSSDSSGSSANGSESGAEQPKTPTEEDPKRLLIDGNLAQLSNGQPYVRFSDRSEPWNDGSVNGNGYSLYGIPDSGNADIELASVSSPRNNNVEPAYVTCDQIRKQETPEEDPPYLLAAGQGLISPNLFNLPHQNGTERAYVRVADIDEPFRDPLRIEEAVQAPREEAPVHNSGGYVSFGGVPANIPPSDDSTSRKPNGYVSFGSATPRIPSDDSSSHKPNGYVSFRGATPKILPSDDSSTHKTNGYVGFGGATSNILQSEDFPTHKPDSSTHKPIGYVGFEVESPKILQSEDSPTHKLDGYVGFRGESPKILQSEDSPTHKSNGYVGFGGESPKILQSEDSPTHKSNGYVGFGGDSPKIFQTEDSPTHKSNGYVGFGGESPKILQSEDSPTHKPNGCIGFGGAAPKILPSDNSSTHKPNGYIDFGGATPKILPSENPSTHKPDSSTHKPNGYVGFGGATSKILPSDDSSTHKSNGYVGFTGANAKILPPEDSSTHKPNGYVGFGGATPKILPSENPSTHKLNGYVGFGAATPKILPSDNSSTHKPDSLTHKPNEYVGFGGATPKGLLSDDSSTHKSNGYVGFRGATPKILPSENPSTHKPNGYVGFAGAAPKILPSENSSTHKPDSLTHKPNGYVGFGGVTPQILPSENSSTHKPDSLTHKPNGYVGFGGATPKILPSEDSSMYKANGYVSFGGETPKILPSDDSSTHKPNGYASFGDEIPKTPPPDDVFIGIQSGYVSIGNAHQADASPKEDNAHKPNGYVSCGDARQAGATSSKEEATKPGDYVTSGADLSPKEDVSPRDRGGNVCFGDAREACASPKGDAVQNSNGYVSFGNVPKTTAETNASPYVPHRT